MATDANGAAIKAKTGDYVLGNATLPAAAANAVGALNVDPFFLQNHVITDTAGEDLTNAVGHFVKHNSSGKVIKCTVAGEFGFGVLVKGGANDTDVQVATAGAANVNLVASAAIVKGATLATTTAGTAATAASGNYVLAMALEAAVANATFKANVLTFKI